MALADPDAEWWTIGTKQQREEFSALLRDLSSDIIPSSSRDLFAWRFRVRGFIEQGTTTTPFDMTVRNRASRYHLVMDAINNARRLPRGATALKQWCEQQLVRHEAYVVEHLEDMPEVRDWSLGDWAQRG